MAFGADPLHDVLFCGEAFESGCMPDGSVIDQVLVARDRVDQLNFVLKVLLGHDVSDIGLVIRLVPKLIFVDDL